MPLNPRRIQQFNTILQGIARMGMQGADMLDATLDAAGMLRKNAGRAARNVEPIREASQLRLPLETRVNGRFGRVTGPKDSSVNRELTRDIGRPEPIRTTPRTEGQMDMGLERGALTRSPRGGLSTDINTAEDAVFRVRGGELAQPGSRGLVRQESRGLVRSPGGDIEEVYVRKVYPEAMGPESVAETASRVRGGMGGPTVDVEAMAPRNAMQNIGVDLSRMARNMDMRNAAVIGAGAGLAGTLATAAMLRGEQEAGEVSPTSEPRPDSMPLTGESYTPNTDLAGDLPVTRTQQQERAQTIADDTIADTISQYAPEVARQMPRSPEQYNSIEEYRADRNRSSDERREMAERNMQAQELLAEQVAADATADALIQADPVGAYELGRRALVDPNQSLQTKDNVSTATVGSQLGDNNLNNAEANSEYAGAVYENPSQGNTDLENATMGFNKPVLMTENQAEKFGREDSRIESEIQDMLLAKAFERRNDPTSPFVGPSTQLRY